MLIICTARLAKTTVGHIDHAMAYPLGLQRLGHEVYVMEDVGPNLCTDSHGRRVPFEEWDGRLHFEAVAKSYGIWPRCCLIYKRGEATHGLPFAEAVKIAKRCDLLVSRSGQIKTSEILEYPARRAYVDGNPGSTQVFLQERAGDQAPLDRYDYLFTMGLNIGTATSPIPTGGRQWRPIVRPVVLSMWPNRLNPHSKRFTTVSTWKGRATFQWEGQFSGEKSDNWLKFIELPTRTSQELEVALRIESATEQADREIFRQKGWRLIDPQKLCQFEDYRDYIGQSRAEFSVAHNRYVEFATGWFSDRSAVYLASGKPVLVQATGIEDHLPTGKGLLTFTTIEEAVSGIEEINRDYLAHCRTAREIAEEYFDSDKILAKLLAHMGC